MSDTYALRDILRELVQETRRVADALENIEEGLEKVTYRGSDDTFPAIRITGK